MISLRLFSGLGHSLDAAGGHRHPNDRDLLTPLKHLVGSDISGTMAVNAMTDRWWPAAQ